VACLQRLYQRVALCQRQGFLPKPTAQHPQIRQLLINAKALRARQRKRSAFFIRQQRAAPWNHGLECPLKQQRVFQFAACQLVKQCRVKADLRRPQRIKFGLDHGPVDVQVVAFVDAGLAVVFHDFVLPKARPHCLTHQVALMQPFTDAAATGVVHVFTQFINRGFERAAVVVGLVGAAVAFKPSPLVDVKQRPRELGRA